MEKLHVGTMGWSYDFWRGHLYPDGTENLLTEYAKNFDTVELNTTFYRIPSRNIVRNWTEETPDGFIFSAKLPRKITHIKMLKDCQEELEVFLAHMSLMGNKRGPMLIQLPHGFVPEMSGTLNDFLADLPKGRFAVEVRNKKWLNEKFCGLLREHAVALVLLDHPWMPDMNTITADFTYIRWSGDRKKVKGTLGTVEKDRSREIKDWAVKIKGFLDDSIEVFGYFSKYYSGYPPGDVRMLSDSM